MENDTGQLTYASTPLTARDRAQLRYRWHRPVFATSALMTAVTVIALAVVAGLVAAIPSVAQLFSAEELGEFGHAVLVVLGLPFGLLALRLIKGVKPRSNGFIVTPGQFPEVAALVEYYARLAGLKNVPHAAIVTGDNPTSHAFGNLIALHSDLLDAPRRNGDRAAMRFAIAREMGHIAAGHRTFWYQLCTTITQSIPYFSGFLTRAEEYTADNYGAVLAPDGAADYFAVLAVSKDVFQHACMYDVAGRAGTGHWPELVANWSQPAPPITWRVRTMAEYGLFKVSTANDCPDDPILHQERTGKPWRINVASLPLTQARPFYWVSPKPLDPDTLASLCPKLVLSEWIDQQIAGTDKGD